MFRQVPHPFLARLRSGLSASGGPRAGAIVFIVAVFVRLFVLFRAADTPHFLPTQGDMKFYSDWALRIAGGQWTDHQSFYGLPLYAYLLAALYKLIGFQPYAALLIQILAEATTALVIFRLAPLAFASTAGHGAADSSSANPANPAGDDRSHLVGWLAALGWIFFVPAQAYSTILMPTTYFVAAFWFVVWWTLRQRPGLPRARAFFLLGLFMGFMAMMVANILFLSGFVVAALFFRRAWTDALPAAAVPRWRARAVAAALLLAGIGLGTSPCWLHNYFVAGEPVLLSAHSGINFYMGNNPDATGYPKPPAGLHADQEGLLKDSITYAEKQVGRPLRHYEVSAYWSKRAHDYIAGHPGAFARLLLVKLGNFWNTFRYDDLGVITPMQEDGVLLPGPGFGFVALFGLAGMVLAAAWRPRARWIAAAVLLHMASLLMVFVTERYRMAAVPGLLLLGSYGLVEGVNLLRARRWVPAAAYAALIAGAFLLTQRPASDPSRLYLDDYNSGVADLENDQVERARPKLERVYRHSPNNIEAVFSMGNLALAENHPDEAAKYYLRTLQLDPRHHRAMNNLGVLAMQARHWDAALKFLTLAQEAAPGDAKVDYLLAQTRFALHDRSGALQAIEAAIRLRPDSTTYLDFRRELNAAAAPTVAGP